MHKLAPALIAAILFLAPASAWAIVSSDTDLDISSVIGAQTFYSNGYTGSGVIVANIEAGLVWNGQQSLTNVTTQLYDPSITPQYDMHATWVGSAIAGQGTTVEQRGIAYGATLWSGAIATSWVLNPNTYSTSFNVSDQSFVTPYLEAMVQGVNGTTADIINSSYNGAGPTGQDSLSITLDSLLAESGKLLTVSAGNGGSTPDTIGIPAAGMNAMVVGALQSDISSPAYDTIAGFSSRSPTDFYIPAVADITDTSGTTLTGVRARVDITAPGSDLTLAHYGGDSGGNAGTNNYDSSTNLYNGNLAGTSFSAPIVAGGAALIVDAGQTLYPTDPHAIDGRVLKAVLMNSASKPTGWNNGQSLSNGIITTTQSLDETYGSGILNLNQAYTQYVTGTHEAPAGGTVQPTGWTYGNITHNPNATATNDYTISQPLPAGSLFNATLTWYADETNDPTGLNPAYGSFDNLDLKIYQLTASTPTLIAQSISLYNSSEELSFPLPSDGTYMLEVSETNYVWNFNGDTTTPYGLAWSDSLPEPTSAALLMIGSITLTTRRPRRTLAPGNADV